jgi:hypothetical protein
VVVRDDLDERLDLGALGNLLGPHALGHLLRVSLDTSGNNVGESLLLGAVIELLDDDNLFVLEAMDAGRMSVKAVLKSRKTKEHIQEARVLLRARLASITATETAGEVAAIADCRCGPVAGCWHKVPCR